MTGDEMELALAAHLLGFDFYPPDVSRIAQHLLPVVRKIAADELRAAADEADQGRRYGGHDLRADLADSLRARAAALDPTS